MFDRNETPTPFQIGSVNTYLSGHTLVDPGPDSDEAWASLVAFLDDHGLAPADVERVLITHPHPDHFGLAARLRADGATTMAAASAVDRLEDFAGRYTFEQEYFEPFFVRHGMPERTASTVTSIPEDFLSYAPSVDIDVELADGDTVDIEAGPLGVRETRGHAIGELLFTFDDGLAAIVGDHVLGTITPAPFLQPPTEPDGPRPRMVVSFNESLRRLRDDGFERFLPGHRDPISSPRARVEAILDAHESRTERVLGLIDDETTAFGVMRGLFGELPVTEHFPGMSEAIGHLDVLEERGEVTRRDRDGAVQYRTA